jgi:hypothetical protein
VAAFGPTVVSTMRFSRATGLPPIALGEYVAVNPVLTERVVWAVGIWRAPALNSERTPS